MSRLAPLSVAALCLVLLAACGSNTAEPGTTSTGSVTWEHHDVELDGSTVSVTCAGEGAPTVWFVSDLAMPGETDWTSSGVPSQVARRTTACVYDRPGLGASGPASSVRSVEQQADELATIIEASGTPTPVIPVGHGYGTFITRLLASRHLPLVAGMVLVDPTLWHLDPTPPTDATDGQRAEYDAITQINEDLGGYGGAALPPPPAPTLILGPNHLLPSLPPTEGATAGTTPPEDLDPSADERRSRQEGLAKKSPFGRFEAHDDTGSSIQHWQPAVVVAAVDWVLDNPDLKL